MEARPRTGTPPRARPPELNLIEPHCLIAGDGFLPEFWALSRQLRITPLRCCRACCVSRQPPECSCESCGGSGCPRGAGGGGFGCRSAACACCDGGDCGGCCRSDPCGCGAVAAGGGCLGDACPCCCCVSASCSRSCCV